MISSFLQHGAEKNVQALLNHWLKKPSTENAQQWLFNQQIYPNNTVFYEHFNCDVLLSAALHLLPKPQANDFPVISQHAPNAIPDAVEKWMARSPDDRLNRTLIWKNGSRTEYLKIQSLEESRSDYCRQYTRLSYLYDNTSRLGLKSHCGKPEGLYLITPSTLNLPDNEKTELLTKVGFDQCIAMHFSLPSDQPYEVYANAPDITPEQARYGMKLYAHDYGRLWQMGINGPDALSAYHDENAGRKYHFLASLAHIINLGVMDSWRIFAHYPNLGGMVGMRDHVDSRPCQEFGSDYLSSTRNHDSMMVNPDDPTDVSRVRLLELARSAWGMVLLWGDRYNNAMEQAKTPEAMEQAKRDNDFEPVVLPLLATLFSEAFSMDYDECESIMKEDGLYAQAVREMRYWMDNVNAPYVKDIKTHRINHEVYPDYPESMRAQVCSEEDVDHLTEHGFVNKEKASQEEDSGRPSLYSHLGAIPNGRNPLLSLNALVVKMITRGCLHLSECSAKAESEMDWETT
jgi:hypothetical protein